MTTIEITPAIWAGYAVLARQPEMTEHDRHWRPAIRVSSSWDGTAQDAAFAALDGMMADLIEQLAAEHNFNFRAQYAAQLAEHFDGPDQLPGPTVPGGGKAGGA